MNFEEKRRKAFKVPEIPKYFQYLSQPFVGGGMLAWNCELSQVGREDREIIR